MRTTVFVPASVPWLAQGTRVEVFKSVLGRQAEIQPWPRRSKEIRRVKEVSEWPLPVTRVAQDSGFR
ncbi:hypothetical protein GCM10010503_25180 [Streptomyces lucensis JCM 4490]|uniref:Uncharacterized protein n=1 Tax=Streptomyces lucensis JCM 4490 TaxID=1306176 RepID=A0A918J6K7_9ACTN|nr:hypothetical protein GCM10010503_25180 [Streptomyces lucensis JCM 4490]